MKTAKLLLLVISFQLIYMSTFAQVDFRKETIYFLMTTRFFDGDTSNNVPNEWCSYNGGINEITDPNDVTWRGDFKGLIQKLDYIKDLGFTAIWITPIVQNAGPLDYHGYHAWDFMKVDARLESPGATFQDLINEVHNRDMKIVLDIVTNHSGRYGIKDVAELKYNTDPTQTWGQDKNGNPLQPNPNWEFDGLTPNPDDNKIWSRANIATMPAPYNENLDRHNWPGTESFVSTSDENWYHHSGNGFAQGWDDTENLYNRALAGDTPDLNTKSSMVRDYLIAAYTNFINMGVDALRWDTMKHMDKEDVLYFYDAFKAVNPDLFIFGETAQKRHELHNVEEINPHWYTWRGAVGSSEPSGIAQLDFYAEASFHNVFEDGGGFSGVQAAARYDHLYSDPSTNLLWLDNHDFGPNNDWNRRFGGSPENLAAAMNFMFTWRGIPVVYYGTETQFKRGAYADIHEAADINRSLENTGRAYYGNEIDAASQHKIYQHIKKLNAIRKAVPALQGGEWRWDGNGGGNAVGYVRTKGSSIVAVGLAKDGDASFNFSGLQNGVYVDAVTSKSVTVSNGNLSFSVKSTSAGIYVFNGPGMIGENGVGFFEAGSGGPAKPISSASPASGNYVNPVNVTLSASLGNGTPYTIYYTSNGSEPTTGSPVYANPINVNENTVIKVLVKDKDGNLSQTATYNYTIGEIEGLTVYFKNVSNWNSVNVHYWNEMPDVLPNSNWPGPNMVAVGDGWYSFTFEGVSSTNLLFSNNGGSKTADMSRNKSGWYNNGIWYDTDPRIPVDFPPTLNANPTGGTYTVGDAVTISLTATDDKDANPAIYYTLDGSMPNQSSTLYTNSFDVVSSVTIKAVAYDMLNQASTVNTYSYVFNNPSQGLRIHYKPNGYSNPTLYFWNATPNGASTSWPGVAMSAESDGWYEYTIEGADCSNLIFSNNGGSQTTDLNRCGEGWYQDGVWYASKPEATTGLKVHFKKPSTWNTAYIHYWNAQPNGISTNWPGKLMTHEGNDWYVFTIDGVSSANVIFNNNGSPQTIDLNGISSEVWYDNGWVSNPSLKKATLASLPIKSSLSAPYPNPFTNEINISTEMSNLELSIQVRDLNGRLVYSQTANSNNGIVKIQPDIAKGIYIIQVTSNHNSFIYKVVKN